MPPKSRLTTIKVTNPYAVGKVFFPALVGLFVQTHKRQPPGKHVPPPICRGLHKYTTKQIKCTNALHATMSATSPWWRPATVQAYSQLSSAAGTFLYAVLTRSSMDFSIYISISGTLYADTMLVKQRITLNSPAGYHIKQHLATQIRLKTLMHKSKEKFVYVTFFSLPYSFRDRKSCNIEFKKD